MSYKCEHVQARLKDLVLERLSSFEEREVRDHVKGCQACQTGLKSWEREIEEMVLSRFRTAVQDAASAQYARSVALADGAPATSRIIERNPLSKRSRAMWSHLSRVGAVIAILFPILWGAYLKLASMPASSIRTPAEVLSGTDRDLYNQAVNDMRAKKYLVAIDKFKKILDKESRCAECANNIGDIYAYDLHPTARTEADIRSAIDYFGRAVKADPTHAGALYNLGVMYQAQWGMKHIETDRLKAIESFKAVGHMSATTEKERDNQVEAVRNLRSLGVTE
jgi:tetratricopeptide (TPR) repeat protein